MFIYLLISAMAFAYCLRYDLFNLYLDSVYLRVNELDSDSTPDMFILIVMFILSLLISPFLLIYHFIHYAIKD